MGYKVKVQTPVQKRGLFGFKKTVMETRTVEVDRKTYKRLKKEQESRPISLEEMILYDELFGD